MPAKNARINIFKFQVINHPDIVEVSLKESHNNYFDVS